MTQTLERGIKSEQSEAERTRGNERPMMFGLALGDVSKHPIDRPNISSRLFNAVRGSASCGD